MIENNYECAYSYLILLPLHPVKSLNFLLTVDFLDISGETYKKIKTVKVIAQTPLF